MNTHIAAASDINRPGRRSLKTLILPTAAAALSAPFRRTAIATAVLVVLGVLASAAQATAPGVVGDIVFQRYLAPAPATVPAGLTFSPQP